MDHLVVRSAQKGYGGTRTVATFGRANVKCSTSFYKDVSCSQCYVFGAVSIVCKNYSTCERSEGDKHEFLHAVCSIQILYINCTPVEQCQLSCLTMGSKMLRNISCTFMCLPPDWMVSECKVAEASNLNKSPLLTTTAFSGWWPGFQLLRDGLWSGQFSGKMTNHSQIREPHILYMSLDSDILYIKRHREYQRQQTHAQQSE